MKKTVLALFLVAASVSQAGTLVTRINNIESEFAACSDRAESTYEQNMCADDSFEQADLERRRIYKQVLAIFKEEGASESKINSIKEAEQFWLAVRDKKCADAGEEMRGGSGEGLAVGRCLVSETVKHVNELISLVSEK